MRPKNRFLLGTVLCLALLAGCTQAQEEPEVEEPTSEEPSETEGLALGVVEQWLESGHPQLIAFAAAEEDCVRCHDGGAFALGVEDPAELDRDWSVATDCRACHSGRGPEIASDGTVDIPTMDSVEAGLGALCMSCHNGRRAPNPEPGERLSAPHHSVQADVLTGSGGMPIAGVTYTSNTSHEQIQDACVACHMATPEDDGLPSHTMAPGNYDVTCGGAAECHQDDVGPDVDALADYDGDGQIEAYTAEVEGLLDALGGAIKESVGGTFTAESGVIVFTDSSDATVTPTTEQYSAAWNHMLVDFDGSRGVHNPGFVVPLLQDTYAAFTGEDSPGEPMEINE